MTAQELSEILMKHPDAPIYSLNGQITRNRIHWTGKNYYINSK